MTNTHGLTREQVLEELKALDAAARQRMYGYPPHSNKITNAQKNLWQLLKELDANSAGLRDDEIP